MLIKREYKNIMGDIQRIENNVIESTYVDLLMNVSTRFLSSFNNR